MLLAGLFIISVYQNFWPIIKLCEYCESNNLFDMHEENKKIICSSQKGSAVFVLHVLLAADHVCCLRVAIELLSCWQIYANDMIIECKVLTFLSLHICQLQANKSWTKYQCINVWLKFDSQTNRI